MGQVLLLHQGREMSEILKSIYLVGLNILPKNLHLIITLTNRRIVLHYLGAQDGYLLQDLVLELTHES